MLKGIAWKFPARFSRAWDRVCLRQSPRPGRLPSDLRTFFVLGPAHP